MRLEKSDVELFYRLWFPLLDYVNRTYRVCPETEIIDEEQGVDPCDAKAIADYLWSHTAVLEEYLAAAELPEEYAQIVAGWKRCKPGRYILERHLKKGSVFLSAEDGAVYMVKGLCSTWEEMEWLFPVFDYYSSLRKSERRFEILLPLLVALVSSAVYVKIGKVSIALDALAELLPTAVSILIGFTVMLITLLLTTDSEQIRKLKEAITENRVRGKKITLYQKLHIQLTESLFSEVFLLLAVFAYLFYSGITSALLAEILFLVVEVYLTAHILLGIIRSITHLYCVFYSP